MDAGTSAVYAGAIAGAVSLGGILITSRHGRRQLTSDAQLQLREPRKSAYINFLLTSREALNALSDLWELETQEADSGRIEGTIDQHRPALQLALAPVSLEGPEVVSEAAHQTVKAFNNLHTQALMWNEFGGDTHEDGRPIGFGSGFTREITEALDHYLKEARKALATLADDREKPWRRVMRTTWTRTKGLKGWRGRRAARRALLRTPAIKTPPSRAAS